MTEPSPVAAGRPQRPSSARPESLGFKRRTGMVRWLSPKQLAATAVRVLLSAVFGSYSDKREIQAAFPCPDPVSYAGEEELWVDYVADLGDAFGPTYAVATLLAQPQLALGLSGSTPKSTSQGRLLVMGGDQVYPTPSITDYRDHTTGPYRAALPYTSEDAAPHLFAIPGNHDWYDGLTAFMRVFCRKQWIGGWRSQQERSYFAVQLRENWWLYGIDIQFDTYIDEPQLQYFEEVAGRLKPGDSVILCSAKPTWVDANEGGQPDAFSTLDYFERKIIRARKAELRLALSGNSHHYARYVREDGGVHRMTAGGGGAFLTATHNLPGSLELPPAASNAVGKTTPPERFTLETTYPSKKTSRALCWRIAALPFKNWSMSALVGGVHLLYAWMIHGVLRAGSTGPSAARRANKAPRFSAVMSSATVKDLAGAVLRSPPAAILSVLIIRGMSGFTESKEPAKRAAGAFHGVLHLALAVAAISVTSAKLERGRLKDSRFLAGFVILVGAGGGLLGSWLLAAYLFIADRLLHCNTTELFAAQRNRDYKNFVRIHFDRTGGVTVYPVKVARTPRRWKLQKGGAPNEPWFEPEDVRDFTPELIEEPIRIAPVRADG